MLAARFSDVFGRDAVKRRLTALPRGYFRLAALALAFDASQAKEQLSMKVYEELNGIQSMHVARLRETECGGVPIGKLERSQQEKNEAFIGCMMYVLGTVDMLRELQKIDRKRPTIHV